MTNSINGLDGAQELLIKLVEQNPGDWETRKKVVQVLYDAGFYRDASKMVWSAPEIPPVAKEVVLAARIVSKGQPSRAMRLFDTVIEKNIAHPEENLAMAKLLVKEGMSHQAIRFYGAATALDSSLKDENFELALVGVDSEEGNWNDVVKGDEFPWESPTTAEEREKEAGANEDPYAALLDGATQPVPMKAPVREKPVRRSELPTWKVEEKRVAYHAGGNTANEQTSPVAESAPIDMPRTIEPKNEPAPVEVSQQEIPQDDTISRVQVVEQAEVESPQLEPVSEPKQETVPEPVTEAVVEKAIEATPEMGGAFFKSYDDAHEHIHSQDTDSKQNALIDSPFEVENIEDLEENTEEGELPEATLVEHVSDTMAETHDTEESVLEEEEADSGSIKNKVGGMFSSLVSKMRRKSAEEKEPVINVDELDLSGVAEFNEPAVVAQEIERNGSGIEPAAAEVSPAPEPVVEPEPKSGPVAVKEVAPRPMAQAVKEVKKPEVEREVEQLSVPKELDGRTQLVSLAPEDGTAFFSELRTKYQATNRAQLPQVAIIARDMANVDYLDQVNKACSKDLDAFSKLLGLHKVMHTAGCSDWVADMNLLRKGYGDAVLATVVSKYSVTECREILNSVYSYPAAQSAAV